ncbi:uncharacterized protein [Apostichopus japonicus]|uniref:uncharacterized protein isoform X1 n=1 Tax=Stichopus japonicus TaxID=307972 RepID=UPI003AB43744
MQDADVELEEDEDDTGENGVEQDADVQLEDDEDDTEDSGVEEGADEELEEDVDIEETDMKVSEMADPSYKDDDDDDASHEVADPSYKDDNDDDASHQVADPSYKDDDDVSHISESEYDSDVSTEIPMPSVGQRKNGENATGGVQILTANNSHKRLWDKHHFCVYCEVSYAKLPRHMEAAHSSELEVAEILSLDKGSKERSRMWEILRNKGNHAHNVEVLTKGRGFIVPVKRPTNAIPVSWYLPCKQCLGYYIGSDMWKHLKVCPLTDVKKPQSKSLQSECALLLPMKGSNAAFREKVLGKMNRDEVSVVVRNDETIIQLGERIMGSVYAEAPFISVC